MLYDAGQRREVRRRAAFIRDLWNATHMDEKNINALLEQLDRDG